MRVKCYTRPGAAPAIVLAPQPYDCSELHGAGRGPRAGRTLLAIAFAVGLLVGCSRKSEPTTPSAAAESSEKTESRLKHGTNGAVIVTLDAATQKVMGLQTAALAGSRLSPETKAYGRVLDVSPLVSLVAELVPAQAAGDVSTKELSRLKTLAAQNNASERALEAAEAAAARDQAQVESVRLRLLANWGRAIAGRADLVAFVQSLVASSNALVQLDVPAGEPIPASLTTARLVTVGDQSPVIEAQFLGPAPAVDPQTQGKAFLFLVSPNPSHLLPGAAVLGFINLPGEPQTGVTVPRAAIVRFNGTAWVYVRTGEETFQREEVALGQPLAEGWFVREGLKPKEEVVTAGAQQLLSEELKGQAE